MGVSSFLLLNLMIVQYLGLRSGGPKQVTVGISSFEGFCSAPDSPCTEVEAGVAAGVRCSFFDGGWGDELWPWRPRLRFGDRQRRRALNCRNSSPRRFPREVRRTGLLKLGSRRLRRERLAGERWKESSGSSPFVSTIEGSLGSCKTANTILITLHFIMQNDNFHYRGVLPDLCLSKYKLWGYKNRILLGNTRTMITWILKYFEILENLI